MGESQSTFAEDCKNEYRNENLSTTKLMSASQKGQTERVTKLLKEISGKKLHKRDERGDTALHKAAAMGHYEIIQQLISKGADLTSKNADGFTPFHLAVLYGKRKCATLLLETNTPNPIINLSQLNINNNAHNHDFEANTIAITPPSTPHHHSNIIDNSVSNTTSTTTTTTTMNNMASITETSTVTSSNVPTSSNINLTINPPSNLSINTNNTSPLSSNTPHSPSILHSNYNSTNNTVPNTPTTPTTMPIFTINNLSTSPIFSKDHLDERDGKKEEELIVNEPFPYNPGLPLTSSTLDRKGVYTWTIRNYSKIEKKATSPAFSIGGVFWRLICYPHGSQNDDNLSLFVEVANVQNLDGKWSYLTNFTFTVVSHSYHDKRVQREVTGHKFDKVHSDLGFPIMVKKQYLYDVKNAMLLYDQLIIEFNMEVISKTNYSFDSVSL